MVSNVLYFISLNFPRDVLDQGYEGIAILLRFEINDHTFGLIWHG